MAYLFWMTSLEFQFQPLFIYFPPCQPGTEPSGFCFFLFLSPVLGTLNFTFMNGFWLLIYSGEPFLFAESDAYRNQSVTCWKWSTGSKGAVGAEPGLLSSTERCGGTQFGPQEPQAPIALWL